MALMLVAACSEPGGEPGVDGGVRPLACDPAIAVPPPPDGTGSEPVGSFDVEWTCITGCDAEPPMYIMTADRLTIADVGGDSAVTTWSRAGTVVDQFDVFRDSGCWLMPVSISECRSAFYVCPRAGQVHVTLVAVRDALTGAEQTWRMN